MKHSHNKSLSARLGQIARDVALWEGVIEASADSDPRKARRKYGKTLIRINWQYADVALKRPELKHVCTWHDGDEGFIFAKP